MDLHYLFTDPPQKTYPPENMDLELVCGGETIYGSVLLAARDTDASCPTVVLLHGIPGHEKNLDIAQALRRTGVNVAYFSYRGAWGSRGNYSIEHILEDSAAVVRYICENAARFHTDPQRLFVVGHSLGGFAALHTLAARTTPLRGGVLIAPCDLGMMFLERPKAFSEIVDPEDTTEGCLRTPYPGSLREETARRAQAWRFSLLASRLRDYPLLFIGGTRDTVTPPDEHIAPLRSLLPNAALAVLEDGHGFENSRVALSDAVARWLRAACEN